MNLSVWAGLEKLQMVKFLTPGQNTKDIIKGDENGAFDAPVDIAFNNKNIFISDCFNNRLVKIDYNGKFSRSC